MQKEKWCFYNVMMNKSNKRIIFFKETEKIIIEKLDFCERGYTTEGKLFYRENPDTGRWIITSFENIDEKKLAKAISELLKDAEFEVIMIASIKFYRACQCTEEEILNQIFDNKDIIEQSMNIKFN